MTTPRDAPVAGLHASIDRWWAWRERARAVLASPVMLVEGSDARGVVTVRVDERCRVVAIRLRNTWRDVVDPASLGAVVVDAVADAVQARLQPSVDVLADVEDLPVAELLRVLDDDAELGAELTRSPGRRPVETRAVSIEAVEAQLAELDRVLSEQEAIAASELPPTTVTGGSRRHEVAIDLGPAGLPVRVTCRLDWARASSVDRLTSALAEAFVEVYAAADDELPLHSLPGAA